jgi:alcohol dehydrogenase class IV
MADAVPDTVSEFVKSRYPDLKKEAETDNNSSNEKITAFISLIDKLFNTFKTPDSTHDAIVDQLNAIQIAYASLELDASDYPRYETAAASLNTIVDALKGAGEGEGEGGQEEGGEEEEE